LRIACVGGGPAGLYLAVLLKRANPDHEVTVYERNRADDTYGFGVVFSENTMGHLSEQDRRSYPEIMEASRRWDPFTVIHGGEVVRCGGVGFAAIERRRLLTILQRQARGLGVDLRFEREVTDLGRLDDPDLIILCDGVNSRHRAPERFGTSIELGPTRFVWLGTTRRFDSLTFFFEASEHGVFGAHVYPYADDRGTFIVETDEDTWRRAGMDTFGEEDTIAYCERLFARHLEGHRLLSNRSLWQRFRTVRNRRWHDGRLALIGDAAHTAHFSVGSGTKMAMEDALALSQALARHPTIEEALTSFEDERRPRVEHIQRMAGTSFDWWASFRHHTSWPAKPFTFHFLTRSQFRYDTLKQRDPGFVAAVEAEAGLDACRRACLTVPPTAADRAGRPGPELEAALVAAARGPAGLILAGAAAVTPEGRWSPDQLELSDDAQVAAWSGVLARARPLTAARIGVQLNHAGPRAACRPRAMGLDDPLPEPQWPLLAASAQRYTPRSRQAREMDRSDMAQVADAFAAAARRALAAGFDWLELQFGHGYLVGTFVSPLTNRRTDEYGGGLDGRLRFPLEVLAAVRSAWPRDRMLAVAISATDWAPAGLAAEEALAAARRMRERGADVLTVLGGQTVWRSTPPYGRCFQMLLSGRIRNEAGVPTMAVGGLTDLDDVKTVLLSGRAQWCRLDHVRLDSPS
jgi:anthraniloyl-CoA monooxygenase